MQQTQSKSLQTTFLIGVFLVGVLYFCPAITNLLFVASVSVSAMNLVLAILASVFLCVLLSKKNLKMAGISSAVGVLLLVLCIFLSLLIDDWSWDGNTYHKAIAGFMKYGWNPLQESFFSYRDTYFPYLDHIIGSATPWYDTYPKGTETWGACVYALLNNIEAGKSYNLVGTFATIAISFFYLSQIKTMKPVYAFICAVFLALNPVTISQMFTYYNDGFMWQMWLICCLALLYLTFSEDLTYQKESYFLIFATIGIGLNTKFSAAAFFAPLCIGFFVYWCIQYVACEPNTGKRTGYICKRFLFFVSAVISAFFLIGATSYISNYIRYANPLYGTIGEGSADILTPNLPTIYNSIPNFVAYIASVFSKSSNSLNLTEIEWKLPFIVDPAELVAVRVCDTRIGGWGVFFSGLFLISIIVLVRFLWLKKYDKKICIVAAMLLGINLLWIVFVPAMCWARYYVAPLYLPVLAMIAVSCKPYLSGRHKLFIGGISLLLMLNFLPNCQNNFNLLKQTKHNQREYELLQQADQLGNVIVDASIPGGGEGLYFNLFDLGLSNVTYQNIEDSEATRTMTLAFPIRYKAENAHPLFCSSIKEYLSALTEIDKSDMVILVSVMDEASYSLTEEIIGQMQQLGLDFPLQGQYRSSYLAVLDQTACLAEECSPNSLTFETEINGNKILVASAGADVGNYSSIQINGVEYSLNRRGLNIVLMDRNTGDVLDSVCLDTCDTLSFWR